MKVVAIICVLLSTILFLSACGMPLNIIYDGKERSTVDVEEAIESKIELENPNLDVEVTITQDNE